MAEVQDFRAMGEALGDAGAVLRTNAGSAGLAASVPTRKGWTVFDLVCSAGMSHRKVADHLTGATPRNPEVLFNDAADAVDLLEWLDEGLVDVLNAFTNLPAEAEVEFFLPGALPARDGWLRRHVHETSVHAIDAMAARLGRAPAASELWLDPYLAADGVDELLLGFLVRDQSLHSATASRIRMDATDVGRSWLLKLGPQGVAVSRVESGEAADDVVSGAARELYLRLWGRGGAASSSDQDFWGSWSAVLNGVCP